MSRRQWREKSLDQIRAESKLSPSSSAPSFAPSFAPSSPPSTEPIVEPLPVPVSTSPEPTVEPVAPRRNIRLNHALTVVGVGTSENFTETKADTKTSTLLVDLIEKDPTGVTLTFGRARYWIPDAGIDYIREVQ